MMDVSLTRCFIMLFTYVIQRKDVIGKLNLLIIEIHWKHATANVWLKHKWATTTPYME
jgi:hypothetical protein